MAADILLASAGGNPNPPASRREARLGFCTRGYFSVSWSPRHPSSKNGCASTAPGSSMVVLACPKHPAVCPLACFKGQNRHVTGPRPLRPRGSPAGAAPFGILDPLSFLVSLLPLDLGLSALPSLRNLPVCTPLVSAAPFPSLASYSLRATLPLTPPPRHWPTDKGDDLHIDVRDPLPDPLGRSRLALATDLPPPSLLLIGVDVVTPSVAEVTLGLARVLPDCPVGILSLSPVV